MMITETTTSAPRPETHKLPLTVLHVACGPYHPDKLHPNFRDGGWREVRLDADPSVRPDIVSPLTDMAQIQAGSMHAVWCPYGLVRLWAHEVPLALREFHRVLRPEGFALVTTPDLQRLAELVVNDQMDQVIISSPVGPITVRDVLFGHGASLEQGKHGMAHRTGFSARTLGRALLDAGFANVDINRTGYDLWALAEKTPR